MFTGNFQIHKHIQCGFIWAYCIDFCPYPEIRKQNKCHLGCIIEHCWYSATWHVRDLFRVWPLCVFRVWPLCVATVAGSLTCGALRCPRVITQATFSSTWTPTSGPRRRRSVSPSTQYTLTSSLSGLTIPSSASTTDACSPVRASSSQATWPHGEFMSLWWVRDLVVSLWPHGEFVTSWWVHDLTVSSWPCGEFVTSRWS